MNQFFKTEYYNDAPEIDYLDTKFGRFNKNAGCTTIYIGNMDFEKTELEIKDLFEAYGFVNYVKIIKDPETHNSKGIAFVQMNNSKHAKLAIKTLNASELDGRTLKVSEAENSNSSSKQEGIKRKRRKPYKAYVSKKERGL